MAAYMCQTLTQIIHKLMAKEIRTFKTEKQDIQLRADGISEDNKTAIIKGYAALFNSITELYQDTFEIVMPGAFDDVLRNDVRCLFNHEASDILGRGDNAPMAFEDSKQSLRYGVDNVGLFYECRLDLMIDDHADLYRLIQRGDITQSSFSFTIAAEEWVKDSTGAVTTWTRKITKIDTLYDVAPVTFPAYADTTVAAQSRAKFEADLNKVETPQNIEDEALVARSKFNILKNKFKF